MAQIKTGTANVTNGSATVTFTGVTVVGAALIGHAFNVRGEDAVYSLAADATAPGGVQTIQLTAPYAGTTGAVEFQITTSFSPITGLYEPDINDVDIAILLKHMLVRKIDAGAGMASHLVTYNHSLIAHTNRTVLDDLTDNSGVLNYKGLAIGGGAPSVHADRHLPGGADPIPLATSVQAGLMAALDKIKLGKVHYLYGNVRHTYNGASISAASSTVTLSGFTYVSSDIGKYVVVQNAGGAGGQNLVAQVTGGAGSSFYLDTAAAVSVTNTRAILATDSTPDVQAFIDNYTCLDFYGEGLPLFIAGPIFLHASAAEPACAVLIDGKNNITITGPGTIFFDDTNAFMVNGGTRIRDDGQDNTRVGCRFISLTFDGLESRFVANATAPTYSTAIGIASTRGTLLGGARYEEWSENHVIHDCKFFNCKRGVDAFQGTTITVDSITGALTFTDNPSHPFHTANGQVGHLYITDIVASTRDVPNSIAICTNGRDSHIHHMYSSGPQIGLLLGGPYFFVGGTRVSSIHTCEGQSHDPDAVARILAATATGGTTNTLEDTNLTLATGDAVVADEYIGQTITITGGTGAGQTRTITDNTPTSFTVGSNWTTVPDATSVYSVSGNVDPTFRALGRGKGSPICYGIVTSHGGLFYSNYIDNAKFAGMFTYRAENTIITGNRMDGWIWDRFRPLEIASPNVGATFVKFLITNNRLTAGNNYYTPAGPSIKYTNPTSAAGAVDWELANNTGCADDPNTTGGGLPAGMLFDSATGRLAVGLDSISEMTTGVSEFSVDSGNGGLMVTSYTDSTGAASRFIGKRAGGTRAAHTPVVSGMELLQLNVKGAINSGSAGDDSKFDAARKVMAVVATEDWTTATGGFKWSFSSRPNGQSSLAGPVPRLEIHQDGVIEALAGAVFKGDGSQLTGIVIDGQTAYINADANITSAANWIFTSQGSAITLTITSATADQIFYIKNSGTGGVTVTGYGCNYTLSAGNSVILKKDHSANSWSYLLISPPGGVTDHGGLTGLTDDDHSQYALLAGRSGANAFTGNLSATGTLTLGSSAQSGVLNVLSTAPSYLERSSTATNNIGSVIDVRRTTSADMADGFGGGILFTVTDSGASGQTLAQIAAVRAGADNTGDLVLRSSSAGTLTTELTVKGSGASRINLANVPAYPDNATAISMGGLAVGDVYMTATGHLMIRY